MQICPCGHTCIILCFGELDDRFEQIAVNGEAHTAAEFGNHTYIAGIKLNGVKTLAKYAEGSVTMTIRPWIRTLEGEIIYGAEQTYIFTPAS